LPGPFEFTFTVQAQHIDALGHVNNEVYLQWVLQAADAHSRSLGYGLEVFLQARASFVVRRQELNYIAATFLGDELRVQTWLLNLRAAQSERATLITRVSDGKGVFSALTNWVYVDLATGRPCEIPEEMAQRYRPFVLGLSLPR